MKPASLVSFLPKTLTGDANDDLKTLVAALANIFRQMDDFSPLRATGGDLLVGTAQLATGATKGFLQMPRFQGKPTGMPQNYNAGSPFGFDEKNDIFYVYDFARKAWVAINEVQTEDELMLAILLELEQLNASF